MDKAAKIGEISVQAVGGLQQIVTHVYRVKNGEDQKTTPFFAVL